MRHFHESSSTAVPDSAGELQRPDHAATMVYQAMIVVAVLLLLGSLMVF